jgi:hypothetical protein
LAEANDDPHQKTCEVELLSSLLLALTDAESRQPDPEGISMFESFRKLLLLCALLFVAILGVRAQDSTDAQQAATHRNADANVANVASILKISDLLDKLRSMRAQTGCGSPTSMEELAIRQDVLEAVETSSLEVDGVLAELDNERAHLFELRAALASRRDQSLGLLNVANIITGTGLGIATNALQFSDSTAKIGDYIGVISGLGSTTLSVLAIRRQRGPRQSVGRVPNMLAPLFGRQTQLNSYYPPTVLEYLHSMPSGQGDDRGSRLDQLIAEWRQTGRIGPVGSPRTDRQITRLTSSLDRKTKLSIDDISDRIAMLADVSGRVGLTKRDLAELMRSIRIEKTCTGN